MPIYEYRCDNCGHEFETIRKVADEPLKACPACEQEALRKKVSAAAFRLKGGGWYETDFKSDKKRNVAGDEKAAKDGGESGKGKDGGEKGSGDGAAKGGDTAASKPAEGSGKKSEGSSKSASEGKGNNGTSKPKTN